MNMCDGQFGPRLVDKSVEEAELIIPLDSDMFSKGLLLCRRLDQYILPVKSQAFVRDLGALDLHGPKALHRVDEELKIASAPALSA